MNGPRAIPIDTIVFDLDGTLVDSAPDICHAVNRLLAEEDRRALSVDEVILMIGDGITKLVDRAMEATGAAADADALGPLTARFVDHYEGHETDRSRPYPGAVETVFALADAGYRLGICTNKPQAATHNMLAALGFGGVFPAVVGGDSIAGVHKPDPRHLLAVLDALGADPAQAVMVGDNQNDVAAARGAGVPVIAVSFGYSRIAAADLGADAVIGRLGALAEVIGRLP